MLARSAGPARACVPLCSPGQALAPPSTLPCSAQHRAMLAPRPPRAARPRTSPCSADPRSLLAPGRSRRWPRPRALAASIRLPCSPEHPPAPARAPLAPRATTSPRTRFRGLRNHRANYFQKCASDHRKLGPVDTPIHSSGHAPSTVGATSRPQHPHPNDGVLAAEKRPGEPLADARGYERVGWRRRLGFPVAWVVRMPRPIC